MLGLANVNSGGVTQNSISTSLVAFGITLLTNFDLAPTLTDGSHHPATKFAAKNE
jgi:hypothetical protein